MTITTKEVIVNAPMEKIFSYVNQPSNLPQLWPSLININNVKPLDNGGYSFRWAYKMSGINLKGTGLYSDIIRNVWFTCKIYGAVDGTITWTFRAGGTQTKVILSVDYAIHLPLFSRLTEITATKMNDEEAELILANLRQRFELTGLYFRMERK